MKFDYDASAELFMPKRKRGPRRPIAYRSLRHGGGGYPLRCRGFSRHPHAPCVEAGCASTATTSGACTRVATIRAAAAVELKAGRYWISRRCRTVALPQPKLIFGGILVVSDPKPAGTIKFSAGCLEKRHGVSYLRRPVFFPRHSAVAAHRRVAPAERDNNTEFGP